MSTIGARVKELRQAKGLSQQALSGDGISPGYVSLIESGKRTPSAKATALLAERLGVSVERLTSDERPAASDAARLEANFARLSLENGDPQEALRCLSKICLDDLDARTAGDAAMVLAESLQQTGQLDRAVSVLESLVERCRRDEAWLTLATSATTLAVMYLEGGDIARALEIAEAALTDVEAAGLQGSDEHFRLGGVFTSALVERGDLVAATNRVEDLVEVAQREGSPRARGSIYWAAATVAHERGHIEHAVQLTDRAVALFGEEEGSRDLPRLRLHYAWLLLLNENPRAIEALLQLDHAESDPAMAGARLDLGQAAMLRGRAYLCLGQVDDAAEQAARALTLLGPSEHGDRTQALILLGDVGTAQLQMDLATESFAEAEQVLFGMESSRTVAGLWRDLGDGWRNLGETHRAMQAYDQSFRMVGFAPRPKVSATSALAL